MCCYGGGSVLSATIASSFGSSLGTWFVFSPLPGVCRVDYSDYSVCVSRVSHNICA